MVVPKVKFNSYAAQNISRDKNLKEEIRDEMNL